MRIRTTLLASSFMLAASAASSIAAPFSADYARQLRWHADVAGVGRTWDVAIVGNRAYVAATDPGLQIFDVSTPRAPVLIGTFASLGEVRGVDVSGNYAFLAVSDSAVAVVDISDPASPSLLDVVPVPGVPLSVSVDDGLAAVGVDAIGVLLFDVSDPASLNLVGTFPLFGQYALDVDVSTSRVYVAASYRGLLILDTSDPTHPNLLGHLEFSPEWVVGVEPVGDDLLYLGIRHTGVAIVDVQDPSQPDLLALVPVGRVDQVHVDGARAYVGGIRGEVLVFDVSDPLSPTCLAKGGTRGVEVTGLASIGPCLYVGLGYDGLAILDRTFETTIAPVGVAPAAVHVRDVVVHGDVAAASWIYGVELFDISSPHQPVSLGKYEPPWTIYEVAYDGRSLYVMSSNPDLTIVDVTDPAAPQPVSTTELGGISPEGRLLVDGSLLWVTTPVPLGLQAVDVSDPAHPVVVGTVTLPNVGPMWRVDDLLYVGLQALGMAVVDVSDPETPTVIATFPSIKTDGLWIDGNLLYAVYGREFGIWSLENPVAPAPVSAMGLLRGGQALAVDRGFAYVEGMGVGAQVFDVSNPVHPRLLGAATFLEGVAGHTLALHDGLLCLPGSDRIGIFAPQRGELALAASVTHVEPNLMVAPNPFRDATTIRMFASRSGPLDVDIYDVCGRRIRTLVRGTTSAGSTVVTWAGDDGQGDPVAAGVYFVRVNVDGTPQTARVVRTR